MRTAPAQAALTRRAPFARRNHAHAARRGFTMVELLVVASVMLLLTVMVVSVFSAGQGSERIRAGARQIQSSLAGARDRAIHAGAPRGIRLIQDPNDPSIATAVIYIGANAEWSQGIVQLGRPDTDVDGIADSDIVRTLRGYGTGWKVLYDAGLLASGARIRLPANGSWYTVDASPLASPTQGAERLLLTTDYRTAATIPYGTTLDLGSGGKPGAQGIDDDGLNGTDDNAEIGWPGTDDATDIHAHLPITPISAGGSGYILELLPSILPNEKPVPLPSGVAIDLDNSRISPAWYTGNVPNRTYFSQMDIMFSPRGAVVGPLAAQGLMHLVLAETRDTDRAVIPWLIEAPASLGTETRQGESLLVTLFTRTGNVSSHPVNLVDADSDGLTDDPFRFAETGAVAGK